MTIDSLKNILHHRRPRIIDDQNVIHAAVAVPLVTIDGEDHILFTVRSSKLRWQPGEISFPGGHCEAEDSSDAQAAIRECTEELGISAEAIELLGPLDCLVSAIGVRLHAVAVKLHTLDFYPSQEEVQEVFTVPLDVLRNMEPIEGRVEVGTKPMEGFPHHLLQDYKIDWKLRQSYGVYFYLYNDYVIWGLTGRVLKNFLDIYDGRIK